MYVHMQIMSPDEETVYFAEFLNENKNMPVPRRGDSFWAWHDIDGNDFGGTQELEVVEVRWSTRIQKYTGDYVLPPGFSAGPDITRSLAVEVLVEPVDDEENMPVELMANVNKVVMVSKSEWDLIQEELGDESKEGLRGRLIASRMNADRFKEERDELETRLQAASMVIYGLKENNG
jgi:hypothetical protein